jgi:hypothetical protein
MQFPDPGLILVNPHNRVGRIGSTTFYFLPRMLDAMFLSADKFNAASNPARQRHKGPCVRRGRKYK